MKAKKYFAMMLCGEMFAFVACEKNPPVEENPDGDGTQTEQPITPIYTVTLSVNDEAMGTVTGAGTYEEGAEVTLEATANEGYKFVKWSDEETENPRTITVNADVMLTAIFAADPFNGHAYVDLGLPSGTLWATCNVGATSPEEYGDYFAWGETTTKTTYDWSTYKYGTYNYDGDYSKLTKYNPTDGLTTLEAEDDAAHVHWGGDWRMPTYEEQTELLNNCTWTWTDNYNSTGKAGYIVSSKAEGNGTSIFLPAAGVGCLSMISDDGMRGYYGSSSLYAGDPGYVYDVYFEPGYYGRNYSVRCYGLSVRAVCSK